MLIDFGLAKDVTSGTLGDDDGLGGAAGGGALAKSRSMVGMPSFRAPEVSRPRRARVGPSDGRLLPRASIGPTSLSSCAARPPLDTQVEAMSPSGAAAARAAEAAALVWPAKGYDALQADACVVWCGAVRCGAVWCGGVL